jgi:Trk-type K+ transport system membrane component
MGVAGIAGSLWRLFCSTLSKSCNLGFTTTKLAIIEFVRAVATYVLIMKVMKAYPPTCELV